MLIRLILPFLKTESKHTKQKSRRTLERWKKIPIKSLNKCFIFQSQASVVYLQLKCESYVWLPVICFLIKKLKEY